MLPKAVQVNAGQSIWAPSLSVVLRAGVSRDWV